MSTYTEIAPIYDLLHDFKDYAQETAYVRACVRARMPGARSLLDLACGTGNHVPGLLEDFEVEGLDLSPQMLAEARRKFPQLRFHEASMTGFELGRRFDVVCCLFRSIAAARTPQGLDSALAAMAGHVVPGGLVLIEPFFTPESFWVGDVKLHEARAPGLTVSWMHVSERRGDLGVFRNHYLIGRSDGIVHCTEDHELGLFRHADFVRAFAGAGLTMEHDPVGPSGLGFYVGRKPDARP